MKIKKSIIFLIVVLAGLLIYVAAGPFITIHQIKTGIDQRDSEKLSDNIDFPALRANLKEQFNAVFMKNAAAELEDNPFAVLAIGLASKLIDGIVDAFVTPSGLASLMSGKKPEQPEEARAEGPEGQNIAVRKTELFKNARYTYDGISKFSAWIPDEKGEEIRFVFMREVLSWKLSKIIIPLKA
jgi:hypothetical protein